MYHQRFVEHVCVIRTCHTFQGKIFYLDVYKHFEIHLYYKLNQQPNTNKPVTWKTNEGIVVKFSRGVSKGSSSSSMFTGSPKNQCVT
jgi:hypothetical protein